MPCTCGGSSCNYGQGWIPSRCSLNAVQRAHQTKYWREGMNPRWYEYDLYQQSQGVNKRHPDLVHEIAVKNFKAKQLNLILI